MNLSTGSLAVSGEKYICVRFIYSHSMINIHTCIQFTYFVSWRGGGRGPAYGVPSQLLGEMHLFTASLLELRENCSVGDLAASRENCWLSSPPPWSIYIPDSATQASQKIYSPDSAGNGEIVISPRISTYVHTYFTYLNYYSLHTL
jgi:hypothetical protein